MVFANGGTAFHAQHPEAQGLMVGARSRSSIDNSWLTSVLYYDNKMRVIRTFSQNVYGQIEMLDTEYNHAGEILQTKKVYKESNGTTRTKQKIYSFDHAGRKTAYNLTIGNLNDRIANYEYDEIGRQKQKIYFPNGTFQYGGAKDYIIRPTQDGLVIQPNTEDIARKAIILEPTPSIGINSINLNSYKAEINPNAPQGITIAGLQKINYKWHLRGWLLGINLDASNNPTPTASEADLFSYKLDFETAGFYDGNIGKQTWKGVDNNARSYTFAYNTAKQLSNATYSGINGENFNLQGISYNKNGSIKTLQRFGQTGTNAYGLLDNLSYNYNGNRLTQITDSQNSNNTWEFVQRGNPSYNFYTDGSLKSDANEQIQNIIYDTFLKQAVELQLTDGRKQKNYYAGNGNLLKIIYLDASNTVIETWEFSDDIVYKNGTFYQINDDEGRIILENGQYSYEFDYKDHLGNTRVSFKASGNQLIKTAESAFEPWGNRIPIGISNAFQNRWEFQGKTKEATFGLNRVDFGARTMNPITTVWDRIDPLAEKMPSYSPFSFSFNNPVRFIDPDGRAPFDITLLGANNSSVTVKTDLVDLKINASGLGVDFGGNYTLSGNDVLKAAVDIGGVFDPTPTLDIIGASMSANSGDYWGAGASLLGAAVPYAGDLAKSGKIAKGIDKISDAIDASKDFNKARNKAVKWLDEKGFKATEPNIGGVKATEGKAVGMKGKNAEGKNSGFRVEYDEKNGAHINVFSGKDKGPHFTFPASEKTVNKIQKKYEKD